MAKKLETLEEYINSFLQSKECPKNLTDKQLAELHDVYFRMFYKGDFGEIKGKLNYNIRRNLFRMFREGTDYFCYYRLKWLFTKYKGNGITLKERVLRHGKKEGLRLWNEYCKQQSETNTFEYKSEKYGMTKKEFKEYNKSRQVTLENCIKRHGKEKGTKIFEGYCEKQQYTNTLPYFIEKYGEIEGIKTYNRVCKQKAITFENLMRVHDDEVKVKEILSRQSKQYSLGSQELCRDLEELLPSTAKCYYQTKEKEYHRLDPVTKQSYFYDFVCLGLNKPICIEYHGDFWHMNPKMYESTDKRIYGEFIKPAHEIWQYDTRKKEVIKNQGFYFITVWESDYLENKEKCVENIIEELKKNEAI